MREIFNIDPLRDPITNSCRSSSRVWRGARLGLVLAGVALSAPVLTGAATAADMPMPIKAAAAPIFSWTGCYVGINAGFGASGSNFKSSIDPGTHLAVAGDPASAAATGIGSGNDQGVIGGGQVGCNLQTGIFAVGIEGDWDFFRSNPVFANSNGAILSTGDPVSITQSLRTNSLATIRPRLGIVSDRTFIYATGGVAFAKASYTQTYADQYTGTNPGAGTATGSSTLIGWTAGAGWEWAWTDHVSVKTEYLFSKFPTLNGIGTIVEAAAPGNTNPLHGSADLTIQTLRLGLNYRF